MKNVLASVGVGLSLLGCGGVGSTAAEVPEAAVPGPKPGDVLARFSVEVSGDEARVTLLPVAGVAPAGAVMPPGPVNDTADGVLAGELGGPSIEGSQITGVTVVSTGVQIGPTGACSSSPMPESGSYKCIDVTLAGNAACPSVAVTLNSGPGGGRLYVVTLAGEVARYLGGVQGLETLRWIFSQATVGPAETYTGSLVCGAPL